MKHWPLLIALLYVAAVVVFTLPVCVLCWGFHVAWFAQIFLQWWYWAGLGLMFLGQLTLLTIPVNLSDRRSVRRRPVLIPIALAGLMLAVPPSAPCVRCGSIPGRQTAFWGGRRWW